MRVCVIGLGYVGLTLAVYLADKGVQVHGVDISDAILKTLASGRAHFFEQDFDEKLLNAIKTKHFTFSKEYEQHDNEQVIYIVTVGTPLNPQNHVNLLPIQAVCNILSKQLKDFDLVILRSTVRIGVTRNVVKAELDKSGAKYGLAFCPERTIEGHAFEELASLPQIIAGIDSYSLEQAKKFFSAISSEIVVLDVVEEAEMVKLLNNSERDLMFALANEVALMCDAKGLNAHKIIQAANYKYPRSTLKRPGPVGGPCLEKDPYILTEGFLDASYQPKLFSLGRLINEEMIEHSLKKVFSFLDRKLNGLPTKIAILGFSFKGNPPTGDMRGSLVHPIISLIKKNYPNVALFGHDPLANQDEMAIAGAIVVNDVRDAVYDANLVIIQNNHPQYAKEPWHQLEATLGEGKIIFDFWNQLSEQYQFKTANYFSFGNMQVAYV